MGYLASLKTRSRYLALIAVVSCGAAASGYVFASGHEEAAKTEEHAKAPAVTSAKAKAKAPEAPATAAAASSHGLIDTVREAWQSVGDKMDRLKRAEEEVQRISLENANLRFQLESQEFDCQARLSSKRTNEIGMQLGKDTGSPLGRTLAAINYRPPTHLLPSQLYTLALSYFKAHEDEKAAVILSFLSNLDEEVEYRNAKNLLMTGVAWYRVQNYELADLFFDRVLSGKQTADNSTYHAQARLWRGLVASRKGNASQAQAYLRQLIEHHPHSMEARWVNPVGVPGGKEAERVPASAE